MLYWWVCCLTYCRLNFDNMSTNTDNIILITCLISTTIFHSCTQESQNYCIPLKEWTKLCTCNVQKSGLKRFFTNRVLLIAQHAKDMLTSTKPHSCVHLHKATLWQQANIRATSQHQSNKLTSRQQSQHQRRWSHGNINLLHQRSRV